jgi:hypothetical protein
MDVSIALMMMYILLPSKSQISNTFKQMTISFKMEMVSFDDNPTPFLIEQKNPIISL